MNNVLDSSGYSRYNWPILNLLILSDISNDGMTLTFEPAVEYDHISVMQTIDGVVLETRAEVGLLTRNVVVRGSVQDEWTETIEACEEEFDTSKCTNMKY